jgi:predicted nucleic acid-binding protein
MKGIADTGFIVAFANRNDRYHEWATEIAKRVTLSEPLLTCEAALAEAAFHLSSVPYALSLVSRGLLSIGFDLAENLEQVATLASKYQDRKPDLADLCIVRMSELFPRHVIITIDEGDFSVYRKNKRDVIPLLCPPKEYRPH